MRRTIFLLAFCASPVACAGTTPAEGRWEGSLRIPGRELQLVVDLAQNSSGAWTGSIIVPRMGIKGAPLANLVVTDTDLTFDIGNALATQTYGPATFKAHLTASDSMAGEMSQAGNVAQFSLRRIASAQVELPQRSTAVGGDIEDRWIGEFELGGYPRHVTITFENHAGAAATAKFVIVGKQTNELPVDLVIAEGNFLRIESQATNVAFEGRFLRARNEIAGIVELGPFELPLVLRRSAGKTS